MNLHAIQTLRKTLAKRRDEDGTRSYAMLLILLTTGMRASELVRLTRTDFRRDDRGPLISFYRPKRRDRHSIRLSEKTFRKLTRAIHSYHRVANIQGAHANHIFWSRQVRRAGQGTFVFHTKLVTRSVQRIVNSWGLLDGLGRIVATHALRHHVGRMAARKGDFIYAQKLLGHKDPRTTSEFYTEAFVQAMEL
ncbi:MAG: site-specific integrase [Leptospirales bacterium]|nr:site-specific integrase [Leptospirales bacterium]